MTDKRKQKLIDLGAETLADALLEVAKYSKHADNLVDRMISGPISYYYSVRYLRKLDKIAVNIADWKDFEDHEVFKEHIYNDHKRKRSFWGSYENYN